MKVIYELLSCTQIVLVSSLHAILQPLRQCSFFLFVNDVKELPPLDINSLPTAFVCPTAVHVISNL